MPRPTASPPVARRRRGLVAHRADGGQTTRVVGYASVVDLPYDVLGGPERGGWVETIAPGAFDRAIAERHDVRLLLNHEGIPLARSKSGTLRLAADTVGLRIEADLDARAPLVRDVTAAMERGDLDEMSMAFAVAADSWDRGYSRRVIEDLILYDTSLVTYAANGAASAYLLESLRPVRAARGGMTLELAKMLREADALRAAA